MNREIISFQIGNYSNFIGTHFWNIQQSNFVYDATNLSKIPDINHDVLFREGLSRQSEVTFTPRLISIDFRDGLNIQKSIDEQDTKLSSWKEKVDVFSSQQKPIENLLKEEEKNMDESVQYWSDYQKVKYHEKTVKLIPKLKSAKSEDFDLYHYGSQLNENIEFFDDIENRLRSYAEECNSIQGFHFLVDAFNGFGGLSHKYLSLISEEYPKKPILAFFPFPYLNEEQLKIEAQTIQSINTALTMQSFFHESRESIIVPISLFSSFPPTRQQIPLKLNNVDYKPYLDYHTSAILASLVDCTTLPWRQKSQTTNLNEIYNRFDNFRFKICSLKALFPFNLDQHKYLFNYLQENDVFMRSNWFTPMCQDKVDKEEIHSQITCCRGINDTQVKNPKDFLIFKESTVPASQVLNTYFDDVYSPTISKSFSIQDELSVKTPYPEIFPQLNYLRPKDKKISCLTSLQQTNRIQNWIQSIAQTLEKTKIKQYNRYFDSGLEMDDYKELINEQNELLNLYSF